jgi:hypothetical protein
MPTWLIVVFWVVVAVVAVGAFLERRRGHRYQAVDPKSPDQGEFEGRAQMRGQIGPGGV